MSTIKTISRERDLRDIYPDLTLVKSEYNTLSLKMASGEINSYRYIF